MPPAIIQINKPAQVRGIHDIKCETAFAKLQHTERLAIGLDPHLAAFLHAFLAGRIQTRLYFFGDPSRHFAILHPYP